MRYSGSICLGMLGLATSSVLAIAQDGTLKEGPKAAAPGTVACPAPVAEIATCYSERLASGAYVLAATPKDWNGNLIVFGHGGPAVVPTTAASSQSDLAKYSFAVRQGYAWIASSYRREGYGVQMAAQDSEDARRFRKRRRLCTAAAKKSAPRNGAGTISCVMKRRKFAIVEPPPAASGRTSRLATTRTGMVAGRAHMRRVPIST